MNEATTNLISKDGEYTMHFWRTDTHAGGGYWSEGYVHKGHIMRMDNPKRGQIAQMPRGEFFKIMAIGTSNKALEEGQQPAVFLKRYSL
jgi:hypothetical protein